MQESRYKMMVEATVGAVGMERGVGPGMFWRWRQEDFLMDWHSPQLLKLRIIPDSPLSMSSWPFAEMREEHRGRAGLEGGNRECGLGLIKSERPVRHTRDDIKLAAMSVALRGGRGWRQTHVTGVAVVFEATGLGEMVGGERREKGSETEPLYRTVGRCGRNP